MSKSILVLAILGLLLVGHLPSAVAQPSARSGHVMAYDANRQITVLFGGYDGTDYYRDTWHWNGTTWSEAQLTGKDRPEARSGAMMAYDASREVIVLFGGYNGTDYLDDTWEYSGTTWSQKEPDPNDPWPHGRRQGAMAYSGSGVITLFGGVWLADHIVHWLQDTWEWDGTDWTEIVLQNKPIARSGHAMAYDSSEDVNVLFGGSTGGDETWEWNGTIWSETCDDPNCVHPGMRHYHKLSYDSEDSLIVLFGGRVGVSYYSDTWEYDASTDTWEQQYPEHHPSGRYKHAMAYDWDNEVTVLFGGYDGDYCDDTWTYNGTDWTEE
ncbi:MAG TPA: kelch repeat-containing protein [Phycisphaerae bacterium]|nr:kelch repeat-containing protein [Phycisphaerae bacterium]